MDFLSVIGTRPQLIKIAPVIEAFRDKGSELPYIDTGQHYDSNLSDIIKKDLKIGQPIINLVIGSGSHAVQLAGMMTSLETQFIHLKPKNVIVFGDTNSTLATALVASKMGISLIHIESGLRSFNKSMPEEVNRIVTDHLSNILFAPTKNALNNLEREGLSEVSFLAGDVMCDIVLSNCEKYNTPLSDGIFTQYKYLVCTIHRAENTDNKQQLELIFKGLKLIPHPILLFAHPRLINRIKEFNIQLPSNVEVREPVSQSELLNWLVNSLGLITDSGGLQKEAFILKVPCTTLRAETEWIETLENGWNVLVKDPIQLPVLLNTDRDKSQSEPFGNGKAAEIIVEYLFNL